VPIQRIKVKALVDNLTVNDRTLAAGEVADCPADKAKVLVLRGEAEVVEGDVHIPVPGGFAGVKGDATERAVSPKVESRETQAKKG
jgi:hypothetical protein